LVDAAGLFEEPLHIRQTIEASRIARDYLAGEMLLRVLLRARGREGNQHEKRSEHRTSSGEFLLGGRQTCVTLRAGIISRTCTCKDRRRVCTSHLKTFRETPAAYR
jgi:hypothetical protein